MSAAPITGFDLGGAHLKAAQVTRDGRVVAALQIPCPLWQGMDRLESALDEAIARLGPIERTALTMTGELTDLFPDRATGVRRILEAVVARLPAARHRVYAGRAGFLEPGEAAARPLEVASANWMASAALLARHVRHGLLVDIGSTTTDVVPLEDGEVAAEGATDGERLACDELVYTGLTRAPLMALAARVPFKGGRVGVMAELFATAADVYRVLGELDEDVDQHPAADDGAKTPEASARRLARMVGADLQDASFEAWRALARVLAEAQLRKIQDAIETVLSRGRLEDRAPLIGAGIGSFLVARLAARLGRPFAEASGYLDIAPAAAAWAGHAAPAVAVALLLALEG